MSLSSSVSAAQYAKEANLWLGYAKMRAREARWGQARVLLAQALMYRECAF